MISPVQSIHRGLIKAALLLISAGAATSAFAQVQGPSSSAVPYVLPVAPFAGTTTIFSILTVGDSVNNKVDGTPYRFVGIPDGLGAYDNGNGTFTALANHELGATAGTTRAHGDNGSFVSEWVINKSDLRALSGQDLIQQASFWNAANGAYNTPITGSTIDFARFCSADLPETTAFYNPGSGLGTQARIFMTGEESGTEGRAFGMVATGANKGLAYELPALGRFSHENSVANPFSGDKTIVIGTDDATPGQVYVYVGTKTNLGNDVERAGLTNGTLYGLKVDGAPAEVRATGVDGVANNRDVVPVALHAFGSANTLSGAQLQALSNTAGVTNFLRPEDGAWNPLNPSEFYFVTTDQFSSLKAGTGATDGRTRLWKLTFTDLNDPASGATLEMVLEGGTGAFGSAGQMFDNLTIDFDGNILIQEDPGNNGYLAKIWKFNPTTGELIMLAEHNPAFFLAGAPNFLTQDEESSGILDITHILGSSVPGERWYLFDTQAHYGLGGELVEGGQLMAMRFVPIPEPSTYGLIAAAGLIGLVGLRRLRKTRAA